MGRVTGAPANLGGGVFSSIRAAEAAVDVDALAGDVARFGRTEEGHQVGHVAGVAEVAQRDLAGELLLALGRGVQALIDLFTVDAAGGEGVHGDAVTTHVARILTKLGVEGRRQAATEAARLGLLAS